MTKRPARPAPPPPPHEEVDLAVGLASARSSPIALGIAVWSTTGHDTKVSVGTTGTDNSSSSAAETQPVNIVGTPLPKQPQGGVDETPKGLTPPTLKGFTFAGAPIDITPGRPGEDGRLPGPLVPALQP